MGEIRGGIFDEYDDQDCNIDAAPIRAYFDQPAVGKVRGNYSVMGQVRNMLEGDELVFANDDIVAAREAVKRLQGELDRVFSTKIKRGKLHVWRDA